MCMCGLRKEVAKGNGTKGSHAVQRMATRLSRFVEATGRMVEKLGMPETKEKASMTEAEEGPPWHKQKKRQHRIGKHDRKSRRGTKGTQGRNKKRRRTYHNHVHPLLVSVPAAGTGKNGSKDEAIHHSKHGRSCLHIICCYSVVVV